MPADFFIDSQRGVVFSKGIGVLTWLDVIDHSTCLKQHVNFRPEYNQLLDFRDFTDVELTGEQVRQFAKLTLFRAPSKRAFVVSSNVQFGLSRMFGILRESAGNETIVVFREMKEALTWLSLTAEPTVKDFPLLKQVVVGS